MRGRRFVFLRGRRFLVQRFFHIGRRNLNRSRQLTIHGIDGVHHSRGGNGGSAKRVNIRKLKRRRQADELALEGFLQSAGAVALGFVKEVVADDDGFDGAGVIQGQGYGHGAAKALHAGGIGRSAAAEVGNIFAYEVHAAVDGGGGNGGAGDGVNGIVALGLVALDDAQGNGLAGVLVGKFRLLGQRAQASGFVEVLAANVDAHDDALGVQANRHFHGAAIAVDGNGGHITNQIAVGVQALKAAIQPAAFLELHFLKTGRVGQQARAGLLRG